MVWDKADKWRVINWKECEGKRPITKEEQQYRIVVRWRRAGAACKRRGQFKRNTRNAVPAALGSETSLALGSVPQGGLTPTVYRPSDAEGYGACVLPARPAWDAG